MNDQTGFRAQATFLRTVVTRNTPFDRFLAGELGTQLSKFRAGDDEVDTYKIMNTGSSIVDTHLLVIVRGLPRQIRMENASGITSGGDPYLRVFLPQGVLNPGQSISQRLVFERKRNAAPLSYTLRFLSGQGKP